MSTAGWDRLVALVPAPSQSVAGRQIEAACGTLTQVRSFLTQEAIQFSTRCRSLAPTEAHVLRYVGEEVGNGPDDKCCHATPTPWIEEGAPCVIQPEEEAYMRQERAQVSAGRLRCFYTWGGRIRHHHPEAHPRAEFYNEHVPGKLVPLRL